MAQVIFAIRVRVNGEWLPQLIVKGCVSFELRLTPSLKKRGGAFAPPLLWERGLGGKVSFGKASTEMKHNNSPPKGRHAF